jgi:hypothetical protein
MQSTDRPIEPPFPTPDSVPFWQAAREGRLMLRVCDRCHRPHWYPRPICPFCFGPATTWRAASGRGVIYSYSVARREPIPYALAYVTLEEGPTMLTNVVDCDFDALAVGQPVELVFKTSEDGTPVPMFRPRAGSAAEPGR